MNNIVIALILLSFPFLPVHATQLVENNLDLYKPDKKSYLHSLAYAKNMPIISHEKLIFHCFWRVPRDFTIKQVTVLKSIIVNHQDHLGHLEINLWSNVDLSENTFFKEVADFVHLRKWDYAQEAKGTLLENIAHINKDSLYDTQCYLEGDLFRLLALHKYGGFYIDMDVLVLRDMSPLNHLEFVYQWGTSGFNPNEPHIKMNGAIMRMNPGSDLSFEFLEKIIATPLAKESYNLGSSLYSKINKHDLLILPGVWFDSEWGFEGATNYAFNKVDHFDLFDGAYAWHWHNKWDDPIEKGSKFDYLEKRINDQFQKLKRDLGI